VAVNVYPDPEPDSDVKTDPKPAPNYTPKPTPNSTPPSQSSPNETVINPVKTVTDSSGANLDGTAVSGGKTIYYTIQYTNYADAARDIVITDRVDSRLQNIRDISSGGSLKDSVITWTLEDVPAGTSGKVAFTADTPAVSYETTIANTAKVAFKNGASHDTNKVSVRISPKSAKAVQAVQAARTGDGVSGNIFLYLALLLVSGSVCIFIGVRKRKRLSSDT